MKQSIQILIILFFAFCYSINAQTSSNEKIAREWIEAHSKELNLKQTDNFKLSFVRKSLSGETLRFQQMMNNVPIFKSEIVVHINPSNEISYSTNSIKANLQRINTSPSITEEEAISNSNRAINNSDNSVIVENHLLVIDYKGQTKLAYRIITNPTSGIASWENLIDAQTGEVLSSKDVAIYHKKKPKKKLEIKEEIVKKDNASVAYVTGTGMIYNPDPLSRMLVAYGGQYVDSNNTTNASLDAARDAVVFPEIDLTAGVYKLKSSYVSIKDFESPSRGLFTQSTNDFSFNRSQYGFEAVNAFYHLDKSMRYINETLGIVCKPFLNGGIFYYDPSGLSGADNSHYIPSSEQIAFGEGGVDDAEDADVILHEFGHGIHDWITHGAASDNFGEGNGDYWAMSYSRSLNQWNASQPAYHYVFSWDGHNTFWPGRLDNTTKLYPTDLDGEVHDDGEIWCAALMQIFDIIGKQKMDKAFLEGIANTTTTSTQQDAAIAVRQAGIDMNYSCADIQVMTQKFTDRGYVLPALTLTMAAITDQTVSADASNTYTIPSYLTLANPITDNCDAVVTQAPVIGTVLVPGIYPITLTATSGTSIVPRTFNLNITPFLSVNENVKQNVVIFPNPAKNQIVIKGEFDSNESVIVYDALGQKVMEKSISSSEEKVDVSILSSGVYYIYFNLSKASSKFVKE